jgi:catechol 2,3-dioxygenase-like lactoylglutathione lyase family enzyme
MHHVALRVADCDRSVAFYEAALGGERLTQPYLREGPTAVETSGGHGGARFRCCQVALGGSMLELFEFLEPALPITPTPAWSANLMHFAVQVEDVPGALAQVERAGGRRLWASVRRIAGGASVVYVADPDHNTIELLDIGPTELVESVVGRWPDASPQR